MKRLWLSAALLVAAAGLSACGGGGSGSSSTTVTTPPSMSSIFSDRFGQGFSASSLASANAEPRDVAAGDVVAVNNTAEPLSFP